MAERVKGLIMSCTVVISAVVASVAPLISQGCQVIWYQPVEPDGLEDFVRTKCKV